jgi:2,3-dihydroxybenzoate decarboxylase
MSDAIDRRGFIGKAATAALTLPLVLEGRSRLEHADNQQPSADAQQRAKPKIKRIAIEEHWTSEDVRLAIKRPKAGNTEKQADLGEIRLAEMDAAGITVQVIANSSYQEIEDAAMAVNLVKKNNDHLAEMIARHPDRFAGFAALPTQDPKAAEDEFERAVKQLGFRGAMIEGQDHANWEFLDSQKLRGLWERLFICIPIPLLPELLNLLKDILNCRP